MVPEGFALPEGVPNGPNCGITAIAAMCNAHFDKVFTAGRLLHGKNGNWKGRTTHPERERILAALGFAATLHVSLPRCSLKTWAWRYARKGVRYMVTTTGHVQVYQDGYVLDQQGVKLLGTCRSHNKIVRFSHTVWKP